MYVLVYGVCAYTWCVRSTLHQTNRCASFLHGLAAITPNANELLAIANAVQQQHGRLPLLPHAGGGSGGSLDGSSNSSGGGGGDVEPTPQQLLAQLAPAAAVVLQQGEVA